ncbi:RNase H domain-containing protein [Trichonephila clavipes]|nr:RNase H domain-containing protein [Trichonephila clavipes]
MDSTGLDIISKLARLGQSKQVCLRWIPSHVGVPGKEAVDELARRGYYLPNPSSSVLSRSEIHSLHRAQINLTTKPSFLPLGLTHRNLVQVVHLNSQSEKKNPRLTEAQISTDIYEKFNKNMCADTAKKILKKTGYYSRVARRRPYIFQRPADSFCKRAYTYAFGGLWYSPMKQILHLWHERSSIEHQWDLLERKIHQHTISSNDMLKSVLKDEWEKISAEETTKLVNSMPKRLSEVLERRGYPTSY